MTPNIEEGGDAVERSLYLLLGVLIVVVNLTFGVIALRDGALKLAMFMLGLAVAEWR